MKKISVISLLLFCLMSASLTQAQSIKMRIANTEFENMRYADAIIHYEQILEKDKDNMEVKTKLAECYRKTNDSKNSLRIYAQLAYANEVSPKTIWFYAQALAANGFYEEAGTWYGKYEEMMPNDLYAGRYVKAYKNMSTFYKDSSDYHVQYVPCLNSWTEDFSPAYYKNGLMFLSNRDQQVAIRRTFELDQTSYLDYYYMPDTALIYAELQRPATTYRVDKSHHRHSDHTVRTSNDTHTVGEYGSIYRFDSTKYHDQHSDKVVRMTNAVSYKDHEGPVAFTKGQDTVFFTRNTKKQKVKGQKAVRHFSLFMAIVENGEWKEPKEVSFNSKFYSTGHPALTPDNRKMYFASDRDGGKGGVDIYVVEYNHGVFSEPVNVEEINTPDDDMFPYVDASGNLYFASDGFPGLGGLDIFMAKMKDDKIVGTENMGTPFNSNQDDFGIIWNRDLSRGFFSSNRKRGLTDDDIYSIEKLCRPTTVYVYDSITHLPVDSALVEVANMRGYTDSLGRVDFCMKATEHSFAVAKQKYENGSIVSAQPRVDILLRPLQFDIAGIIYSAEDNSPIEGAKIVLTNLENGTITEWTTSSDGKYHFPLNTSTNYSVTASKKMCGTHAVDKTTKGLTKSQTLKGDLDMLCQGDIVKVDNIYYDLNKYNIRPDAALELDKLVGLMNQYPDMRIELRSHTDSRASSPFNMLLSSNRAQAVVEYLATSGVVPFRMRAAGYGESLLVNECKDGVKCSEEKHQQNRRTEFKVLSIK